MKTAFSPIVTPNSKILILGTMPGERSLRLQQYYGHAGNHFWKIIFQLFNAPFSKDYSVRTKILLDNDIALWDVLQNCESENSADSSIKNEVSNNFEKFYNQHPKIRKVYFTSRGAEQFYDKHVKKSTDKEYFRLPSPSGANSWKTYEEKLEEWRVILG